MSKESEITMSSNQQKLRLAGTFALLATLALTVSCTGFFVNPTLSSIAVGPASPTIETGKTGNTVQMTVFGTNNDGSTSNNVPVSWSITPTSVATISASGLVTSVSTGTATVTATANQNPSITGTQTVTVTVGCITSITLSQTSGTVTNNVPTLPLMANAATCNGSQDVTSVATWTSSNTSLATVSAGTVSIVAGLTTGGTVTITAAIGNIVSSPPATIAVSP
ncbi:MAG: Ig-like domain-containing protein [Candidatus Sulfotelmatobacter sp.]